jgi:two-component system chemotaxis response regulator CheB
VPPFSPQIRRRLAYAIRVRRGEVVNAALLGGLAAARERSLPDRLSAAAEQLLNLLLMAVEQAPPEVLDQAVDTPRLAASLAALAVVATLGRRRAATWETERVDTMLIGASAGGIEPMRDILEQMEPSLPAAFIVVLHTSEHAPRVMPGVLGPRVRLQVGYGTDGGVARLGAVYLASPGQHLLLEGARMRLSDEGPVRFSRPSIDALFVTAAESAGSHVASVVLSGAGSDGADGTRRVHEAGGVTLAQDPRTAAFPFMPAAAVAIGAVDQTVAVPRLVQLLRQLVVEGRGAALAT